MAPPRASCLVVALSVVLMAAPAAAQGRQAVARAVVELSDALAGSYGDERERVIGALDALDRAIADWDDELAGVEVQARRQASGQDSQAAAGALLRLAVAYTERGRADEALAVLAEAIERAPGDPAPHLLRGLVQLERDPSAAARAFRAAWNLGAETLITAYWLVHADAVGGGDGASVREALDLLSAEYQRSVRDEPSGTRAPFLNLALFRDGAADEPIVPLVQYLEGFERIVGRQYAAAASSLRRAAAADPLVIDTALQSVPARQGSDALRGGRVEAAVHHFREAAVLSPRSSEVHRILGVALRAIGRIDECVASLETAIELDPLNERAHIELISTLAASSERERLERALERAVEALPASAAVRWAYVAFYRGRELEPEMLRHLQVVRVAALLVGKGRVYISMADLLHHTPQREELLHRAVMADPNHAAAHAALGDAYRSAGRNGPALAALVAASLIAPERDDLHTVIGQIYLATNRAAEAVPAFQRAIALRPTHPDAYYGLGHAFRQRGQGDDARMQLDHFHRLQADRMARLRRSYQLARLTRAAELAAEAGRHEEAVQRWEAVVAREPDDARYRLALGAALARVGRPDDAIRHLERGLELDADAAGIRRWLGRLYAAVGRAEESARVQAEYRRQQAESFRQRIGR
jgi:tetratricopeptide (TPR) repeat protein